MPQPKRTMRPLIPLAAGIALVALLVIGGFAVWHLLIVSLGFFDPAWWAPVMVLTLFVAAGLFWLQLWQLWREARPAAIYFRTDPSVHRGAGSAGQDASRTGGAEPDVFVIAETDAASPPDAGRR